MSRSPLLRLKPVEDVRALQDDDAGGTGRLHRRLGAKDLIGFGVGIVVGTGIFTLTGVEAKNTAGPAVVLSFVIAGAVSLLAALCYAELSSSVPTAGSAYTYAYATMGEIFAWIIGWDLVLEFALGAAVVARGWSGYLQELFGLPTTLFGEAAPVNVGAVLITLVLGVVAVVGIRESARVTNVLVVVKVGICVLIIIVGAFYVRAANLTPFIPPAQPVESGTSGLKQPVSQALFGIEPAVFGFGGVLAAAAVVFFAYSGFEAVANLGEETKRPGRDLPLGLLGTLGLCAVLYAGVSLVITGMVPYQQINEGAPLASAFTAVGVRWASVLISVAAVAGLTSVILIDIIAMSRIGFAMGRDRLLPAAISKVSARYGTPYRITTGTVVVVTVLAALVPLAELASLVSIGTLFAFVIVSVAVPVLRRTRPDVHRPFRVPFNPVVPTLSALACLYLMANLSLETWLRFVLWMALGLLVYLVYGQRNARLAHTPAAPQ